MNKINLVILFLVLLPAASFAQDCNCEKHFEWVKKTFEENDAGFQYVIDKKGREAYADHNSLYLQKVKNAATEAECTKLLYEWLAFFRMGHVAIKPNETAVNTPANNNQAANTNQEWETVQVDQSKFEKYLAQKKVADYEGIWELKPYTIGIRKFGDNYLGFIIDPGGGTWKKGEIKLKINRKNGNDKATFYLKDRTAEEISSIELWGSNYLQLGRLTLKRLSPVFPPDESVETYLRSMASQRPYIEKVNSTTLLLRIPTFDGWAKKDIDSIILSNREKILSTPNLIIDLRNNSGGNDASFAEILPLIYTNPVRTVGTEFLSTKLNNQRMLDILNNPAEYGVTGDEQKWLKDAYDKLEKHPGEFVNLDTVKVSISKYDTVYAFPENVGIIINKGNASTTEQFLLAAKQSKKVKLFGTTTFGALDISNMYFVDAPCKEFQFGYCLSRSMRIPEMTIDGKGIQPDYYIDSTIPSYKWVEYVSMVLNGK